MQRLGPLHPGTHVDADGFATRERAPHAAPHVEICMITTPDGATALDGRSGPLGGPPDQEMLRAWRRRCDIVLVGAGTARAENYGPPSREGLRIAVVTRTCNLDYSSPLFASGRGIVVTTTDAPDVPVESVRAGFGEVDLATAIGSLGARVVHVEGGPALNASLLAADLVDAINLTFSPRLGGAHTGDAIATAFDGSRRFVLVDAAREGDLVFARYERSR